MPGGSAAAVPGPVQSAIRACVEPAAPAGPPASSAATAGAGSAACGRRFPYKHAAHPQDQGGFPRSTAQQNQISSTGHLRAATVATLLQQSQVQQLHSTH
jgi:hypothetical protein